MTPEPKPPILTSEMARKLQNRAWPCPYYENEALDAIATEKTKVVPVLSEAEIVTLFMRTMNVDRVPTHWTPNENRQWYGWLSAFRSLGLVAATRDA